MNQDQTPPGHRPTLADSDPQTAPAVPPASSPALDALPAPESPSEPSFGPSPAPAPEPLAEPARPAPSPVRLILHGGAGEPAADADHGAERAALARIAAGQAELDAAIADGRGRRFGAVLGVTRLKNPIDTARRVMDDTPHVLLMGAGAEELAAAVGVALVDNATLVTPARQRQLAQAQASNSIALDHDTPEVIAQGVGTGSEPPAETLAGSPPAADTAAFGTVGAVARDRHGHLAAATSTGGLTNKRAGRVGDTAIPGAGTFADDDTLAVSCTGTGEAFLRAGFGAQAHARVGLTGEGVAEACRHALDEVATRFGGRGGCIAVGADGSLAMPFTTGAMYRAWLDARGQVRVAVGADDGRVEIVESGGAP